MLADQIKSMDWRARRVEICCAAPVATVLEVIGKAQSLLAICSDVLIFHNRAVKPVKNITFSRNPQLDMGRSRAYVMTYVKELSR